MFHHFPTWLLAVIPLLPLMGFLLNSALALSISLRRTRGVSEEIKVPEFLSAFIGCLFPLLSFFITVWAFLVLAGNHEQAAIATKPLLTWMGTPLFEVNFAFLFDHLSAVMTLVVTGVGTLIHFYSRGYMKGDPSFARFYSYLNLFLFFMLLLVLGDNLLVLFVGWEGVGLCSYLLIGFWFTDAHKASCGKKAFVVNRIGDFGFLIGIFFILYAFTSQAQSSDISYFSYTFMEQHKKILAPFATVITLCLFAGATGKSAQIPLYVWLPDAMAGPTPVSALIHAATMVTAGIYMVARLFFIYSFSPLTLQVVAFVGLITAIVSALIAVTQYDIKKVLAYSTVSQLGYMFLSLGVGSPQSAIFHVVTHAFFKACLFLGAGSVIVAMHHEQDIRKMGGLAKKMPSTALAFLFSTLAISGIPPFAGFFSKDEILWNTYLHAPLPFYILGLIAAGLTAFYMVRLFVYTFMGKARGHEPHHIPLVMRVTVLILGILAVVGGLVGVPAVLGGHNYFHHWLAYLTPEVVAHGDHHNLELGLMGLSTVWALLMCTLAFVLYSRNLEWTKNLKIKFSWIYKLMSNKFYVDEIYDFLIIKPIHAISKTALWKGADEKLIDGVLIHGWTDGAQFSARILSRLQTGFLGHYLLYLWVALIVLLFVAVR